MSTVIVAPGFSLLNRWLLYANVMLAPAQFVSGVGSSCPSSVGFLAYNCYNQVIWYFAIRRRQLHALSLLLPHLNLVFLLSYLGGVSSGTYFVGIPLGLGTAGVLVLNTVCAWKSWKYCMPEGYGIYQFFFFGWRTLTPKWHKFMMVWQIGDTLLAVGAVIAAIVTPVALIASEHEKLPWPSTTLTILPGAAVMLFFEFPLILWTELIVKRNHIDSPTDWVAVWLFVAQVVAMILPGIGGEAVSAGKKRMRGDLWKRKPTVEDGKSSSDNVTRADSQDHELTSVSVATK